jgi:hypothetical protein
LLAGIDDAKRLISTKDADPEVVNGWTYQVQGIGKFGTNYLLRAKKGAATVAPVWLSACCSRN